MEFKWYGQQVTRKTYFILGSATESFLVKVFGYARQICPYDTGELQGSIRIEVLEKRGDEFRYAVSAGIGWSDGLRGMGVGSVGQGGSNKAFYAIYQELGFKHYASGKFIINPYLRPAFNKYKYKYKAAVRIALRGY
jgi:hypothetical protein